MSVKSDVLVLGASGKAGALVAAKLEEAGHTVRRASRSSDVPFDWEKRSTWDPALSGADAVFFLPTETLGLEDRAAFVAAVESAGVERIVQLSVRGLAKPGEFHETEAAVAGSKLDWTILRPCWFAQDFAAKEYFLDGVNAGTLATPAGDGKEPFIHAADIAEVAVAALTSEQHAGKVYEISGPELLTFAEALTIIGDATGRSISHVPASIEDTTTQLTKNGHEPEAAAAVAQFLSEIANGADAFLSTGVKDVLGKEPRSFESFAKQAAAEGAWA